MPKPNSAKTVSFQAPPHQTTNKPAPPDRRNGLNNRPKSALASTSTAKPCPPPQAIVHEADVDNPAPSTRRSRCRAHSAGGSPVHAAHLQYEDPTHLSTLEQNAELRRIRTANITPTKHIGQLTKFSQEYVRRKATQSLNFGSERAVFKHLESVNVNDSVLQLGAVAQMHRRRRQQARIPRRPLPDRDPEPVLGDYLRAVPAMDDLYGQRYASEERPPFAATSEAEFERSVSMGYKVNHQLTCEVFDRLAAI